jgi:hypothetical protein
MAPEKKSLDPAVLAAIITVAGGIIVTSLPPLPTALLRLFRLHSNMDHLPHGYAG